MLNQPKVLSPFAGKAFIDARGRVRTAQSQHVAPSLRMRRAWMANQTAQLVYGFHDLETQKNRRIQEIGITEVRDRLDMYMAEVNRVFDAIMGTFTVRKEDWNVNPITRITSAVASRAQF